MWAPDVYDGSPTPITGLMAMGVKAAAFAALVRLLMEAFSSASGLWQPVVAGLAIASMVVGNLIALAQRSLKRMLAYSSIAHAGYLLVAVWTGTQGGAGAVLLYLLAYGVTTLASFGFLTALGRGGERDITYDDIAGLAPARPWLALGLSICMLSLLGFPGSLGFIGKWYILTSAVAEGQMILPVILVLTSVLSAGYYLPVIMAMYMREPRVPLAHSEVCLARTGRIAAIVCVLAIFLLGVWPTGALTTAGYSAQSLIGETVRAVAGR